MKSIRQLVIALVVIMSAALLVAPTFAQDTTPTPTVPSTGTARPSSRTITITQEQINTRLANRPGERLKDLSIVLSDNQITVSFTTSGAKNDGVSKAIVAVVTPGVADGKLTWKVDSLTIDGTAATQDQIANLKARVVNLIGGRIAKRERHFSVTSVTVDSSAITIELTHVKNI